MKIKDLFDFKYGVNLELIHCQEVRDKNSNSINFVARTSNNNGVVARVKLIEGLEPQKAGTLSLATSGSVLSCFVQNEDYYSGRDLYVLTPKIDLTLEQKLFYAMCINKNRYRYSYGRAANKTFPELEIPEIDICNKIIKKYEAKQISTNIKDTCYSLDILSWKEFKIRDIFNCEICKSEDFGSLEVGNTLFVGRTSFNNGVQGFVDSDNLTKGQCISLGMVGSFFPFWQEKDFVASQNVLNIRNPKLNKFNALFVISCLNKLIKGKHSYNRPIQKQKFINEIILLPAKTNIPDWEFMENYIKSLPYGDRI